MSTFLFFVRLHWLGFFPEKSLQLKHIENPNVKLSVPAYHTYPGPKGQRSSVTVWENSVQRTLEFQVGKEEGNVREELEHSSKMS